MAASRLCQSISSVVRERTAVKPPASGAARPWPLGRRLPPQAGFWRRRGTLRTIRKPLGMSAESWLPRFSPDGKWVAYYDSIRSWASELPSLPRLPACPGPWRSVTESKSAGGIRVWTSDGAYLIFTGIDKNRVLDWWAVHRDGGDVSHNRMLRWSNSPAIRLFSRAPQCQAASRTASLRWPIYWFFRRRGPATRISGSVANPSR